MKLKSTYDKKEDIPAALVDYYEESDGKWVLDSDIDTTGLGRDLASERRRRQEAERKRSDLEAKVARWEALGKTDEEIQALIAAAGEREQTELERKGQWDLLKNQMVEQHKTELGKLQKKVDDLTKVVVDKDGVISDMLVETNATAAIAEHSGDPELLMPFIRKQLRVAEADGKRKIEILGADGTPRVNSKGEPLTVSELVAEMRGNERFGKLFKASGSSGGGTPPGGGGGGNHQYKRRADFKTEKERAEFIDANGLPEYQKLPA